MKASIGDRVFVVLTDTRCGKDQQEIRPATVVRDWGGCANLNVHLDGANDEQDANGNPVLARWLTSVSPNEGGAPPEAVGTSTNIGNISGYFFNYASAEKAVADYRTVIAAIAKQKAEAAPAASA